MRHAWTLVALSLAGCNDASLGVFNSAPTAEITSPSDGDTLLEGYTATFRGVVGDPDDSTDSLRARWYLGDELLCPLTTPDEDGSTVCEWLVEGSGGELTLEALDPANSLASYSVSITVAPTDAPTAAIVSPDADTILYADVPVQLEGTASDPEDASGDLLATWTSDVDGELIAPTAPTDGTLAAEVSLTPGDHLLTFAVTDLTQKQASDTVSVHVYGANTAPTCSITPSTDTAIEAGTPFDLSGLAADTESAAEDLDVTWESSLDGVLASGHPDVDGHFDHAWTPSHGLHTLTFTVEDARGALCTQAIELLAHDAPTIELHTPAPDDFSNTDQIVNLLAEVSDDYSAPEQLMVTWASDVDGDLDTTEVDSDGLSSHSVNLSPGPHVLTATVVDPQGLESTVEINHYRNRLPTAPEVSLLPAQPHTQDDLAAALSTPATDADGDTLTYEWSWTVDDGNGTVNAGNGTPDIDEADTVRGQVWTVAVAATDGYGWGPPATASVTIQNTAPALTEIHFEPEDALAYDDLICVAEGSDLDGDTVNFIYEWTVDGDVVDGETSDTLDASYYGIHEEIVCMATPHDGDLVGPPDSVAVTFLNTPPTATVNLTANPSPATVNSTLSCATTTHDDDGDTVTVTRYWTRNGTTIPSQTGTSLGAGNFASGRTIRCVVTPNDGTTLGAPVTSNAIVIENSPPVVTTVTLSDLRPFETETLTATVSGYSDADGNPAGAHRYDWWKKAAGTSTWVAVGTGTSSLVLTNVDPLDEFYVAVTPIDSVGTEGVPVNSGTATVSHPWTKVALGMYKTCALRGDGTLWCWGQVGSPNGGLPYLVPAAGEAWGGAHWTDWTDVFANSENMCGTRANGTLWCWGSNYAGLLGAGAGVADSTTPVQVVAHDEAAGGATWSDWTTASTGYHSCGIRDDGSLWCWGNGYYNQLGNDQCCGFEVHVFTPQQTLAQGATFGSGVVWEDWTAVATGVLHTCGIREDGTAWCWGYNYAWTPTEVNGGYTDWETLDSAHFTTCGLRGNGTAWCGIGLNWTVVPTDSGVGNWNDWVSVNAAGNHQCGLREDGTAWCWGAHTDGQLGNGVSGSGVTNTPVQVLASNGGSGWTDWVQVESGGNTDWNFSGAHTCGIRASGSLWCWGMNMYGQLGAPGAPEFDQSVPARVYTPAP